MACTVQFDGSGVIPGEPVCQRAGSCPRVHEGRSRPRAGPRNRRWNRMLGTSAAILSTTSSILTPTAPGEHLRDLADRLSREFGAPAGIVDRIEAIWRVHVGAPAESFPDAGALLDLKAVAGGRIEVWRPDGDAGLTWLVMPLPTEGEHDLVALIPFASGPMSDGKLWGPSCPEPALRAWGQAVADRLRSE